MATTTTTSIAKDDWTQVAAGPGEFLATADTWFYFAASPTGSKPASSVIGHYRKANEDLNFILEVGEGLFVKNSTNPFKVTITAAA